MPAAAGVIREHNKMIADIPRLLLRPIAASDAEAMQAVLCDPIVMALGMGVLSPATRSVMMLSAGGVVLKIHRPLADQSGAYFAKALRAQ